MTTTNIYIPQPLKRGLVNSAMWLLRILIAMLMVFLGFWFILAAHEGGYLMTDMLVFANHGTGVDTLKVRVLWLSVEMEDGHWTTGWGPWGSFFPPAKTEYVNTHDPISFTDWERGFMELMGSGTTTLISLIALAVLNLRKNVRRFSWYAVPLVLWAVIFDELLYTFISPDPEPLVSASLMNINPFLVKGLVIGLALLQAWLFAYYVLYYRRSRRLSASPA